LLDGFFNDETSVNSVKRFDLDKGYAVVTVTRKAEKGLTSVSKAASKVKPLLINEKKAKLNS
jgi:peptidylprolyl isomerase/peptidyl-prolyl cis-trans isomerase D